MTSPEQIPAAPAPQPEQIVVPDWSEKQPAKPEMLPYEAAAAEIAELDDPTEQREEVVAFIDSVLEDAGKGLLQSVRKFPDGSVEVKSYDKAKLLDQLKLFQEDANKFDGSDISLRIPSAGHLREAFMAMAKNEHAAQALMDGLSDVLRKQEASLESETSVELNEAERQQVSENLGGEALDAVDVSEPGISTGKYDHLLDPDYEAPENSVEAARVGPSAEEIEQREIEARRHADREAWENNIYRDKKGLN